MLYSLPKIKENTIFTILYWLVYSALAFLICFSQLVTGIAAFNQLILGTAFGLTIWFVLFYVLGFHEKSSKDFHAMFFHLKGTLFYFFKYLIFAVKPIYIWFTKEYDNSKWEAAVNRNCPNLPFFIKFQYWDFGGTMVILGMIGAHSGIYYLCYLLDCGRKCSGRKKNLLNRWNETSFSTSMIRLVFFALMTSICLVPFFAIPNVSYTVVFFFKFALIRFVFAFVIFSLAIYACVRLKLGNEEWDVEVDEIKDVDEKERISLFVID